MVIGERLRVLRDRKKWSQEDLALKVACSAAKISRIESGARDLRAVGEELQRSLVGALGCTPMELLAQDVFFPTYFDPMSRPEIRAAFGRLLEIYGDGADVMFSWAEFLPCSIETKRFMESHHEGLFREGVVALNEEDRRKSVADACAAYNEFGTLRRRRFWETKRTWTFRHHMFRSDILAIRDGAGPYGRIHPETRRECLLELADTAADPERKLDLVVVGQEDRLRPLFEHRDTLVAFDDSFYFERTRNYKVAYSGVRDDVCRDTIPLRALGDATDQVSGKHAVRLLRELADEVPGR